jgi:hypothetical protein
MIVFLYWVRKNTPGRCWPGKQDIIGSSLRGANGDEAIQKAWIAAPLIAARDDELDDLQITCVAKRLNPLCLRIFIISFPKMYKDKFIFRVEFFHSVPKFIMC